jgi:putative spermidine/putrescine transport system permease protein
MQDRLKIALLLGPALIVIIGLFFGGLALGLLRSFNYMPIIGLDDPNLDAYRSLLASSELYPALILTFYIAATSTLIATVLAVATALLLRRSFPGRAVASFLVQLNLTIPHLVGAIGILYLFSQSGSFARLAQAAALISRPADFPALIFDPYAIGVILTYVWKELPFITVITLATLQTLGDDHESVARTLGATRWQAFRHVLLPQIMPGVLAASAVVFAFTFGAYEIPALLGASHPQTLPLMAYRSYTDVDLVARPQAMALAMIIAVVSAIMIAVYTRALRGKGRS